jgi:3-polyprenyl-4-hydroxybenzoate decarboxylase
MHDELPMVEIKRRLSWVDFLAPLSEERLDDLLRRAGFVRLKEGEELVIGPEEQAERMLLLVAGKLQVHVMSPSEREHTLSVLTSGSVVVRLRALCLVGLETCISGRWRLRWCAA